MTPEEEAKESTGTLHPRGKFFDDTASACQRTVTRCQGQSFFIVERRIEAPPLQVTAVDAVFCERYIEG